MCRCSTPRSMLPRAGGTSWRSRLTRSRGEARGGAASVRGRAAASASAAGGAREGESEGMSARKEGGRGAQRCALEAEGKGGRRGWAVRAEEGRTGARERGTSRTPSAAVRCGTAAGHEARPSAQGRRWEGEEWHRRTRRRAPALSPRQLATAAAGSIRRREHLPRRRTKPRGVAAVAECRDLAARSRRQEPTAAEESARRTPRRPCAEKPTSSALVQAQAVSSPRRRPRGCCRTRVSKQLSLSGAHRRTTNAPGLRSAYAELETLLRERARELSRLCGRDGEGESGQLRKTTTSEGSRRRTAHAREALARVDLEDVGEDRGAELGAVPASAGTRSARVRAAG